MKKDIKYIIKRIIIGVGISLALMFIKQNVYASEINDLLSGNNTTLINYQDMGDYYVSDIYVNYYQQKYVVPVYNTSTHTPTTPSTSTANGCSGLSFKKSFYSNIGTNDPYIKPANPSTSTLGANWGGCALSNTKYMTFGGIVLDIPNYTFEKDKYYKINMYYLNEYNNSSRDLTINNAINDPEDLKVKLNSTLEVYSMQYLMLDYNQGPYVEVQDSTSSFYNWLLISIVIKANEDTTAPIIYFGYNPSDNLITGNTTYPSTFTSNDHLPLLMFNYNTGTSSWANAMNLTSTRPFIYEYIVEEPSIQIPDFSSAIQDTIGEINQNIKDNLQDGTYTGGDVLDAFSGGGGGAGIAFGTNNLSDILVIPLRFMQKFNSETTCQPVEIPLPKLNSNIALPCMSSFYSTFLGNDIFTIVQLIMGVGLGFKVCMAFYYTTLNLLDPTKYIIN